VSNPSCEKGANVEHMTDPTKKPESKEPKSSTGEAQAELDDKALENVSGGVMGGDDDLEDLEVERAKHRLR
jgi:hypothetical protein